MAIAIATGAGAAAGCCVAGELTVPWAIHALPLIAGAGVAVAGVAARTTVSGVGASAQAALGAAPHRLTNIIAAAVTAPRKLKNDIDTLTQGGGSLRKPGDRLLARSVPWPAGNPPSYALRSPRPYRRPDHTRCGSRGP